MHYLATCPAETNGEGVYHYRLYSVPKGCGMMYDHWSEIKTTKPIDFSDQAIGIEKIAMSSSNEFRLEQDQFDNIQFSVEAHPKFYEVIRALKSTQEIWLEVTLEQYAPNLQPLKPGAMVWPRAKRLVWWGIAIHKDAKDHADSQNNTGERTSLHRRGDDNEPHNGALKLNFKHWSQYYASGRSPYGSIVDVLDQFYVDSKPYPDPNPTLTDPSPARVSLLMYSLLRAFMPSALFAVGDTNLLSFDDAGFANGNDPLSISRCNVSIPMEIGGGSIIANKLANIGFKVARINGVVAGGVTYGPKLSFWRDEKGEPGENSLYRWDNLLSAITDLGKEFQLAVQFELPTLEDQAIAGDSSFLLNTQVLQRYFWKAAARVMFSPKIYSNEMPSLPDLHYTALEGSFEHTPCGAVVRSVHVEEKKNAEDGNAPIFTSLGDLEAGYSESTSGYDEGEDITMKTIFRFPGFDEHGDRIETGIDLYVIDDAGAFDLATGVSFFSGNGFTETDGDWATFHARAFMNNWGAPNAIVEFDFEGVGLEPFGISSQTIGAKITTPFGLFDWGEFPLGRVFRTTEALVLDDGYAIQYFEVFSIERTPDGNGHLIAVERHPQSILGIAQQVTTDTNDPVPPPIILPPVIDAEYLCGSVNFIFGVEYAGDCIDHIDITLDGAAVPGSPFPGFTPPDPTIITPVAVTIDTTGLANGLHSVCVTITPCDGGTPVAVCWTFNVTNPCSGGEKKTFSF